MSAGAVPPLLEVRGLVKTFPLPGSRQVVHACGDISLSVLPGETLGLIGESGSGKTTLGRCVLRLVEPTSGEVLLEGNDITRLQAREMRALRRDVQMVFQEPFDSLNPQMSVGRQVTEPLRIHQGMGRQQRARRAVELLELVGLPPTIADALPQALSPGALQRASIARAIATEPKLIVLDEPTSALPPEAEVEVIALLKDLQRRLKLTYVFISHDLSLVRNVCDRIAVMYLSQVVETGTTAALFDHPRHPYTRALLGAVLAPDPTRRRDMSERLEGEIPSPIDLPHGCYLASRCPYVRPRCTEEPQELEPVGDAGQRARCWRAVEGDLTAGEIERVRAERRALLEVGP